MRTAVSVPSRFCDGDDDLGAGHEQRAVAGLQRDDGHAVGHDDRLLAVLVAQRHLAAVGARRDRGRRSRSSSSIPAAGPAGDDLRRCRAPLPGSTCTSSADSEPSGPGSRRADERARLDRAGSIGSDLGDGEVVGEDERHRLAAALLERPSRSASIFSSVPRRRRSGVARLGQRRDGERRERTAPGRSDLHESSNGRDDGERRLYRTARRAACARIAAMTPT